MKIRISLLGQLGLVLLAVAFSAYWSSRMPDIVPTHWGAGGHPDAYGSKWTNLVLMPGVMLSMMLLTVVLPKLSPKKFEIEPFEASYGYVFFLVSGLMLAMHCVLVTASTGRSFDMTKSMSVVLFGFFALTGNVISKVKPNFYMGVRTPWTLSDERVWHGTHRYAARVWVIGSCIGVAISLLGVPWWASTIWLLIICILPVPQSYFLYRKLNP